MARGDLIVGKIPGRVNSHLSIDQGEKGMQIIARFLSDETEQEFIAWLRKHSSIRLEEER